MNNAEIIAMIVGGVFFTSGVVIYWYFSRFLQPQPQESKEQKSQEL